MTQKIYGLHCDGHLADFIQRKDDNFWFQCENPACPLQDGKMYNGVFIGSIYSGVFIISAIDLTDKCLELAGLSGTFDPRDDPLTVEGWLVDTLEIIKQVDKEEDIYSFGVEWEPDTARAFVNRARFNEEGLPFTWSFTADSLKEAVEGLLHEIKEEL